MSINALRFAGCSTQRIRFGEQTSASKSDAKPPQTPPPASSANPAPPSKTIQLTLEQLLRGAVRA